MLAVRFGSDQIIQAMHENGLCLRYDVPLFSGQMLVAAYHEEHGVHGLCLMRCDGDLFLYLEHFIDLFNPRVELYEKPRRLFSSFYLLDSNTRAALLCRMLERGAEHPLCRYYGRHSRTAG